MTYTAPYGQMYLPMSDEWVPTLGQTSLVVDAYAEIWTGLQLPNGTVENELIIGSIPIIAGSVTIDRNNTVRRTATNVTLRPGFSSMLLPLVNAEQVPTANIFAPYSAEMRIYKGIVEGESTPTPAFVTWTAVDTPVSVPFVVTEGDNDTFSFYNDGGLGDGPGVFTVAPGSYATYADIVAAFMAAVDSLLDPFSDYCTVTNPDGVGSVWVVTVNNPGSADNGDSLGPPFSNWLSDLLNDEVSENYIFEGGTDAVPVIEYACLGIFQVTDVDVVDNASGCLLQGTMGDRASWVQKREFQAPYSTNGTDTVDLIIADILNVACIGMSGLPFPTNIPSGAGFVPAVCTFDLGEDPWQGVTDLAAAAGYELYFDYAGVLQFALIPDPEEGTTCISYLEGSTPSGVTIKRVLSNQSAPNVICVQSQGSHAGSQYQVWWWESDPYKPTFYADAPMGGFTTPQTTLPPQDASARYPTNILTLSTSDIGSLDQAITCQGMANQAALLQDGAFENTAMEIRENAAHDVDDLVEIQRVTSGVYITVDDAPTPVNYVLDRVVIQLTSKTNASITGRPVSFYGE